MEQLFNVMEQIKQFNQAAQTETLTPEQVLEKLEQIKRNIKSIRFPRVPNKEEAVNRQQLFEDIALGYARLEYMYLTYIGKPPADTSKFIIGKAKEVRNWI